MKFAFRLLVPLLVTACRPAPAPPEAPVAPADTAPVEPTDPVATLEPVATPAAEPDDLAWLLTPILAEHGVPGIGAAVIDRNGVKAIGVAGQRRIDRPARLTALDRFHLGSDTKAMTAYVVGRLVDRGEINWDDTLAMLLPDTADAMHPDFRVVTVDQLLSHRAGLPANADQDAIGLDGSTPPHAQRLHVARHVLAKAPKHMPGSAFGYSNLGYIVLGAALQQRTGASWEDLIERELFAPLNITTCGFGPVSTDQSPEGNWAHEHDGKRYRPTQSDNPAYLGPAGTVHCSLSDWGRFATAMFEVQMGDRQSGVDDPTRTLRASTRQRLGTAVSQDPAYARGWMVSSRFPLGEPVLTHDGSNTVNYASIVIAPQRGLALLTVCNAGDAAAQRATVDMMLALMREYGRPHDPSDPHPLH